MLFTVLAFSEVSMIRMHRCEFVHLDRYACIDEYGPDFIRGSRLVSTVIPNTEWTDQQSGIINEGK